MSKRLVTNKKILGDWNWFEILLLILNTLAVLGLLIYQCCVQNGYKQWGTWVAFVCSIANVISVLLATKKRISCFIWGIIAVIGFGAVAFDQQIFGNVLMYWGLYIPAQIVAIFLWRRHSNDKKEVQPTSIQWWQAIICAVVAIGAIVGFTYIEIIPKFQAWWFGLDGQVKRPFYPWWHCGLDSAVLILSIIMTSFVWLRYRERWIVSIIVDGCQIALWTATMVISIQNKQTDIGTPAIMLVSSIVMLMSAIYGSFNWRSIKKVK